MSSKKKNKVQNNLINTYSCVKDIFEKESFDKRKIVKLNSVLYNCLFKMIFDVRYMSSGEYQYRIQRLEKIKTS